MGRRDYLNRPVPIPRNTDPRYTSNFGATFDPIVNRANDQAAESAFQNDVAQGKRTDGGMNFWNLLNPFANATFQGRQLFPGQAATAPRNREGFRTSLFGQPYGESNIPKPGPITDPRAALTADLANEADPARRAALQNFLNGGPAAGDMRRVSGDKLTPQRRGMVGPGQFGPQGQAMLQYLMSMGGNPGAQRFGGIGPRPTINKGYA